jgi:hypothetical protein
MPVVKTLATAATALSALASIVALSGQTLLVTGKRPARFIESIGPRVTAVPIPAFAGAHAIWGATGQDSQGHIWFGVTAGGSPVPSAHLFEYDPDAGRSIDRGNVVEQLKAAGVLRPGEHQAKIHSRIVQGPDNYLYFSSMDEEGESDDGSRLPTWGGHLWRMKIDTYRWEHLLAVPEALIAVAGGGRFVYALGYFGHVLYRFDTKTAEVKQVRVGSVEGHVSRNFVADYRGHVYVPRLRADTTTLDRRVVRVSIVEFSSDLKELHDTPIEYEHYIDRNPTESHGVTGLQEMADGSWFFTTHVGFLYHIVPPAKGSAGAADESAAAVVSVGWFHPDGRTYVASLFTNDGAGTLLGLAHNNLAEGSSGAYQWLTFDLQSGTCRVAPFAMAGVEPSLMSSSLLYGSTTRDALGQHYVVGIGPIAGNGPVVLRVEPRKR